MNQWKINKPPERPRFIYVLVQAEVVGDEKAAEDKRCCLQPQAVTVIISLEGPTGSFTLP